MQICKYVCEHGHHTAVEEDPDITYSHKNIVTKPDSCQLPSISQQKYVSQFIFLLFFPLRFFYEAHDVRVHFASIVFFAFCVFFTYDLLLLLFSSLHSTQDKSTEAHSRRAHILQKCENVGMKSYIRNNGT